MCFCQIGIENNEHFILHCPCHSSHRRDLLDRISNVVDVDPENLSSIDLCNLLLVVIPVSRLTLTNHHIIESTIFFYKINLAFQADLDKLSSKLSPPLTTLVSLFITLLFRKAFSFMYVPSTSLWK